MRAHAAAVAAAVVTALIVAGCARAAPGDFAVAGHAEQGGILIGTAPPGTVSLTLDDRAVRLSGDGRFLVGFGRDAGPSATLTATLADGQQVVRAVPVAARQYAIEAIPTLRRRPAEPDTDADRAYALTRQIETAAVAAARAGDSDETGWTQAFVWPATGRVSGVYGSQRVLGGVPASPHYGTDIAAPTGTLVVAPARGTVRLAQGPFTLEGNLVILDHGHGLSSTFMHLSRIDVVANEHVERGAPLGAIGTTGRSTGPHLHWAMTWGPVKIDAATLVGPMPEHPTG